MVKTSRFAFWASQNDESHFLELIIQKPRVLDRPLHIMKFFSFVREHDQSTIEFIIAAHCLDWSWGSSDLWNRTFRKLTHVFKICGSWLKNSEYFRNEGILSWEIYFNVYALEKPQMFRNKSLSEDMLFKGTDKEICPRWSGRCRHDYHRDRKNKGENCRCMWKMVPRAQEFQSLNLSTRRRRRITTSTPRVRRSTYISSHILYVFEVVLTVTTRNSSTFVTLRDPDFCSRILFGSWHYFWKHLPRFTRCLATWK